MRATREEMDDLVNRHFGFEASDDVDGVMSTLADGAEHEVIPSPVGSLDDPAEQRAYYELLFRPSRARGSSRSAATTARTSSSTRRSGTGPWTTVARSSATARAAR